MKSLRVNLKRSVSFNILLFKFAGLWTYSEEKFYRIYKSFIVFLLIFFNTPIGIYVLLNLKDYYEISEILALFPNTIAALIKNFIFRNKFDRIKTTFTILENPIFQPRNSRQVKILTDGIRLSKQVFMLFFSVGCSCALLLVILPAFGKVKRLPWAAWLPFDYFRPGFFEIVYGLQSTGLCYVAFHNIVMDTFFAVSMIQIGAQYDTLADNVLNMIEESGTETNESALNESLKKCINHHRMILEYAKILLAFFNQIALLQFTATVTVICMTTFVLSLTPPSDPQFLRLFSYEIVIFIQILLYCWFGNEIVVKSNRLCYVIFKSKWTDCPESFKKKLLFFMLATKNPLILFVYGVIPVNVSTFTGIVRSSWAYFTALYNLRKSLK